jgi:hypothetical protein
MLKINMSNIKFNFYFIYIYIYMNENFGAIINILKYKNNFNTIDNNIEIGIDNSSINIQGIELQIKSNDVIFKDKLITLHP